MGQIDLVTFLGPIDVAHRIPAVLQQSEFPWIAELTQPPLRLGKGVSKHRLLSLLIEKELCRAATLGCGTLDEPAVDTMRVILVVKRASVLREDLRSSRVHPWLGAYAPSDGLCEDVVDEIVSRTISFRRETDGVFGLLPHQSTEHGYRRLGLAKSVIYSPPSGTIVSAG